MDGLTRIGKQLDNLLKEAKKLQALIEAETIKKKERIKLCEGTN